MQSVAQFIGCVNHLWGEWYEKSKQQWHPQERLPWFRGVHNDNHGLIPGIYRGKCVLGWDYSPDEAEDMKAEFARRAFPFLRRYQQFREGEYLHMMQHYRCPTRLLDWTEGALIALYFAIRTSRGEMHKELPKPCVWMLNPSWLNYVNDVTIDHPETKEDKSLVLYSDQWSTEKYDQDKIVYKYYLKSEHELAKLPIAIFPPYIDVRVVAQKSVFTIHGADKDGFKNLADNSADAQIAKILITSDAGELKRIGMDLKLSGITETTVFPDLEGLSREVQSEYDMKVRYP
jgi:hypothetical protein